MFFNIIKSSFRNRLKLKLSIGINIFGLIIDRDLKLRSVVSTQNDLFN
jgi:hypothetical protein